MNKSAIFKIAHAAAKRVHVAGESYAVTFGAALRNVWANIKMVQRKIKPLFDLGLTMLVTRESAKGAAMWLENPATVNKYDGHEVYNISDMFNAYGKKTVMLTINIAINLM